MPGVVNLIIRGKEKKKFGDLANRKIGEDVSQSRSDFYFLLTCYMAQNRKTNPINQRSLGKGQRILLFCVREQMRANHAPCPSPSTDFFLWKTQQECKL